MPKSSQAVFPFRIAAAAVFFIGFAQPASPEIINKVCIINGQQEVGADNGSTAIGTGRFRINTATNTLAYSIDINGIPETAAHIHGPAAPEVGAGIIHPLPAGDIKSGVWNYPEEHEAAILAGQTYVNVHSNAFPAGEIRGQIVDFVALLTADQEDSTPASTGTGYGLFNINRDLNTLSYFVDFKDMTGALTGGHFHGPAHISVSAGIIHPFTDLISPIEGTWNYDEPMEQVILDSRTYVNLHTSTSPAGEIRGQVTNIVSTLHGAQEVPPNTATGRGLAFYSADAVTNSLGYYAPYTLEGTESNAHIHGFAPRGVSTGVKLPLAAGSPKKGIWNYADADETGLFTGQTYMNIHSSPNFAGGEIRGQIEFRLPGSASANLWQLYE